MGKSIYDIDVELRLLFTRYQEGGDVTYTGLGKDPEWTARRQRLLYMTAEVLPNGKRCKQAYSRVVTALEARFGALDHLRFFADGRDRTQYKVSHTGVRRLSTLDDDLDALYLLWQAGADVTESGLRSTRRPRGENVRTLVPVPENEKAQRRALASRLKKFTGERTGDKTWTSVVAELCKRHPDVTDSSVFFGRAAYAITKDEALEAIRLWHASGLSLATQDIKQDTKGRYLIYKRILRREDWTYGELVEEAIPGIDYASVVRQSLSGSGRRGKLFAPNTHNFDREGQHGKLRSVAETCVDDQLCHSLGKDKYVPAHAHDVAYSSLCGMTEVSMRSLIELGPYTDGARGPKISADIVLWRGLDPYIIEVSPNLDDPEYEDRRARTDWKAKLAATLGIPHLVVTATTAKGTREAIAPIITWFKEGASHG